MYNLHGAAGTGGGDQSTEDDLPLQNPYELYGLGGGTNPTSGTGGSTGPGYGASPYHALTRDMGGMDIKG